MSALCDVYWNSHGCELLRGHTGDVHVCMPTHEEGPCSRIVRQEDGTWLREDFNIFSRIWEPQWTVEPFGNDVPR